MAWSIFTDGGGKAVAVGWADQLLKLIGAPRSAGNVQFVYDWEVSEGGGGRFNPLNQGPVPGQPNLTTTGQQFGGGAADFASWQAGLTGAAAFLAMPAYQGIRAALRKDDPTAARAALIASPWAASHYNGGASFSNAPVPGGTPVLPPVGPGGAGGISTTSAVANPATCAVKVPTLSTGKVLGIGLSTGPGSCLLGKSEARSLIGAGVLIAGTALGLAGIIVLAAYGFGNTRAGSAAVGAVAGTAGAFTGGGAIAARAVSAGQARGQARRERRVARRVPAAAPRAPAPSP